MVKKIRLIEDEAEKEASENAIDTPSSSELIELAKSMDWKLWEILQTLQRFEKKLTVEDTDEKTKK